MNSNQFSNQTALVVLSGGLDSTTALYLAHKLFKQVYAVSFNYNQKHSIELEYAKKSCQKLGIKHFIQDIKIQDSRSSLTTDLEVPTGHYEEESMSKTVVNNRNSIMFSLATAYAIDNKIDKILVGIHKGDHSIYPDCRTEFIESFTNAMKLANEGFISEEFDILSPFVEMTKTDIAELGILLGLDESTTYSDYEGGEIQKAKSGTSVERIEAISEAYFRISKLIEPYTIYESEDKTKYLEKEFALELLINKKREERLQTIINNLYI
jgi:7-cyano-7-deazaguanine synthase